MFILSVSAVRRSFSRRLAGLYFTLVIVAAVSLISALHSWNQGLMVTVTAAGGELTEGVLGSPRFINPVLALSDTDRDITTLLYSGLLRVDEEGVLVPDLAATSTVSADGLTYSFTIRPEATFHDGRPVTSADIVHTISRIKDPVVKSPKRPGFEGVLVSAPDAQTVIFTLEQPYASFEENLTVGILPAHLWQGISSELFAFSTLNLEPIGSGPFLLNRVKRGSDGQPNYYELNPFTNFALGSPMIGKMIVRFYANEESLVQAFLKGEIESMGGVSPTLAQGLSEAGLVLQNADGGSSDNNNIARLMGTPLPRTFAIFLNQNHQKLFSEQALRLALDLAVDKESIIEKIFHGHATALSGPVPPKTTSQQDGSTISAAQDSDTPDDGSASKEEDTSRPTQNRVLQAQAILQKAGWELNEETGVFERERNKEKVELRFSLTTVNTPELVAIVEMVAEDWRRVGIGVNVVTFDLADLQQNILRSRKYDALLFGAIIGRGPDLFSFWHSSQRNDPGLNIALYTNVQSDKLLERLRTERDPEIRHKALSEFSTIVSEERPAIFLYSPVYLYVVPEKLKGVSLINMSTTSDRFQHVHEWYIETEEVWPFFAR